MVQETRKASHIKIRSSLPKSVKRELCCCWPSFSQVLLLPGDRSQKEESVESRFPLLSETVMKHLICSQSEFKVAFSLIKKPFLKDLNEGCLVYWFTSWEQAASGLCLEAASGKHPTPYCVQIHPIARFRWQTEGGKGHFPSTLCG